MAEKKFHQFSRLPLELRVHIWNITEAEPRVVNLDQRPAKAIIARITHVKSWARPPALLHACADSRRSALSRRLYVQAFSSGSNPRYTWVNFEMDMIAIKTESFDIIWPERSLIQHLTIERYMDDYFFYTQTNELREEFTDIKELRIVCKDGLQFWHSVPENFFLGTYNVKFFHEMSSGRMLDWEGMEKEFPSSWPPADEEEADRK